MCLLTLILFLLFVVWLVIGIVSFLDLYIDSYHRFEWPVVEWKKYLLIFLCGPGWWIGLTLHWLITACEGIPGKVGDFFYEEEK